jgi:hypothetical protein
MDVPALYLETDLVADTERRRICISISAPYRKSTGEWACTFEVSGADDQKRELFGVDGLQALILNLVYLRSLLMRLRKKGYMFRDSESGKNFDPEGYFDALSKPA